MIPDIAYIRLEALRLTLDSLKESSVKPSKDPSTDEIIKRATAFADWLSAAPTEKNP